MFQSMSIRALRIGMRIIRQELEQHGILVMEYAPGLVQVRQELIEFHYWIVKL